MKEVKELQIIPTKQVLRPPQYSFASLAITILVVGVIAFIPIILRLKWTTREQINDSTVVLFVTIMIAVFQGILIYSGIYLVNRLYYRFWQKEIIESELDDLQKQIQVNFFTNLVKINFKYIDKYYLQTQVQADKSFLLSCIAAVTSLIITIIGIIMMYRGLTEPAYVTTAAGVLGELIASIFFYLYNQTVIKMSEYHQKLVLTQNISLALKIAEGLKEPERSKSRAKLIDYLSKDINLYLSLSPSDYSNAKKKNDQNDKNETS